MSRGKKQNKKDIFQRIKSRDQDGTMVLRENLFLQN